MWAALALDGSNGVSLFLSVSRYPADHPGRNLPPIREDAGRMVLLPRDVGFRSRAKVKGYYPSTGFRDSIIMTDESTGICKYIGTSNSRALSSVFVGISLQSCIP